MREAGGLGVQSWLGEAGGITAQLVVLRGASRTDFRRSGLGSENKLLSLAVWGGRQPQRATPLAQLVHLSQLGEPQVSAWPAKGHHQPADLP